MLLIVNGWVVVPVVTLIVSEAGLTLSAGVPRTFKETRTVCGLLTRDAVASAAVSEIEAVYDPGARDADVTLTVKVAVPPEAIVAGFGVTASQPVPEISVIPGLMVTAPAHVPVALSVKV